MADKKLKEKIRKRDRIFASVKRHEQFLSGYTEGALSEIKIRLDKLDKKWDEFEEIQDDIEDLDENGAIEDENKKARAGFESLYYATKAGLQEKIENSQMNATALPDMNATLGRSMGGFSTGVRLPQILLPEFNGDYNDWLSFRDTYVSLIHESRELSSIQKFHYLRASLKGEALKLIETVPLTSDNYLIAWDTIKKRYSNDYLLKKKHMQALLDYPKVKRASANAMHGLVDEFEQRTKILKQLGEETDHWGALLVHLMCSKLDDCSLKDWEELASSLESPSYLHLIEFLQKRSRILEAVQVDLANANSGNNNPTNTKKGFPRNLMVHSAAEKNLPKCPCCGEVHFLVRCSKFLQMKVDDRLKTVNARRLCSNCFRSDHWVRNCESKFACRTCGKKHHSLIHPGFPVSNNNGTNSPGSQVQTTTASSSAIDSVSAGPIPEAGPSIVSLASKDAQVFLSTVVVGIHDHQGGVVLARALLDSGSQINIISERLCQMLKLKRRAINVSISGVGQASTQAKYSVTASINSRISEYSRSLEFMVLSSVTRDLPITNVRTEDWKIPTKLQLADPTFNKTGRIDLLIGTECFYEIILGSNMGKIELGPNLPMLINSQFGWIVVGKAANGCNGPLVCHVATDEAIPKALERFWQVEELGDRPAWSKEETDCEEHFVKTFTKTPGGRYVVKLPKQVNFQNMLGDTAKIAFDRYLKLENRLVKNSSLKSQYHDFMEEYLAMGHMKKVAEVSSFPKAGEVLNIGCYLPHHPVVKESSTTTKVRVVFDGSAASTTGYSLNDALLKGPVIQDELLLLLLRFRKHQVGLVADVEKMYRQVEVHPEDTKYQRIFWRFEPQDAVGVYELQTVTYGLTPSSYLATRVLQQLSEDEGRSYPAAAQAVKKDFYMDDFLSGESTVANAIQLRKELQQMLEKGGFKLRKWCSNYPEVLADLPKKDLGTRLTIDFKLESGEHIKTLGIAWEPDLDHLKFYYSAESDQYTWTKRKILSAIARLFDPLGLAAPVVVTAKLFMQELALLQTKWDDNLPSEFQSRWIDFHSRLKLLSNSKVDRFAFIANAIEVHLHVFADASEKAYGTCLYARSKDTLNRVRIQVIAAKSRVAPLKRLTLPRLELCAAREAARLYEKVAKALDIKCAKAYFWSDSTVVLHWLRSPPNTWKTFVANRVSEIQTATYGHQWHHVAGKENPADLVSRGMDVEQFLKSNLWKWGPEWLKDNEAKWPKESTSERMSQNVLESREKVVANATEKEINPIFLRFSQLQLLLRITAYCFRFAHNCRTKTDRITTNYITVSEYESAKLALIRLVQEEKFSNEIKSIRNNQSNFCKSQLKLLKPFLDCKGILRVGGRLHNSGEVYTVKHPAIIPKSHPYTKLVIEYYHRITMHGGRRVTLSLIRQEYWPLHGKTAVNSVLRKCYRCFRANPRCIEQPTGQLPPARVRPNRPFLITGIDYCGPVYLKPIHRRASPGKAYIAVFVCFSTKAIHLELATDLSTACFLSALRRFIGHHGLPAEIHSDNGKNFVGANNELREVYSILNCKDSQNKIMSECSLQGIKWKFIPPRSPNFGGLWESAVRLAKTAMKRELGNRQLSAEDMQTLLVQISAALNSRPLTPLSDDPNDMETLTPAHFLIGTSMKSLPELDLQLIKMNRLDHYQQTQQIFQLFWQRWRKEYLCELQTSNRTRQKNIITPGSIVILCDESSPPTHWPLARIVDVHPGTDGIVRVVTVRTSTGIYKRPVCKICLLPNDEVQCQG